MEDMIESAETLKNGDVAVRVKDEGSEDRIVVVVHNAGNFHRASVVQVSRLGRGPLYPFLCPDLPCYPFPVDEDAVLRAAQRAVKS